MALAVLSAGLLGLFIPAEFRLTNLFAYLYPAFLAVLLAVLVIGDPGRIDRDRRWLRVVTGVMILTITVVTAVSVARLIIGILTKAAFANPSELLTIGAIVWITNVIAFGLWYWHLDSGGPAARARGTSHVEAAFQFPEEGIEAKITSGWYPQFVDYFALSFNTSTAFSPTDVSAIRHWSKLMLALESAISLAIVGLVVARAVNVL